MSHPPARQCIKNNAARGAENVNEKMEHIRENVQEADIKESG